MTVPFYAPVTVLPQNQYFKLIYLSLVAVRFSTVYNISRKTKPGKCKNAILNYELACFDLASPIALTKLSKALELPELGP